MPKMNLKALGIAPKGRSISKKDFVLMKQVFIGYDKDNDGTVTYKEFVRALDGKDQLIKSASGMFQEMDGDGDGDYMPPAESLSKCCVMLLLLLVVVVVVDLSSHGGGRPPRRLTVSWALQVR